MNEYNVDDLQARPDMCSTVTTALGAGNVVTVLDIMNNTVAHFLDKVYLIQRLVPQVFVDDYFSWLGFNVNGCMTESSRAAWLSTSYSLDHPATREEKEAFYLSCENKVRDLITQYEAEL